MSYYLADYEVRDGNHEFLNHFLVFADDDEQAKAICDRIEEEENDMRRDGKTQYQLLHDNYTQYMNVVGLRKLKPKDAKVLEMVLCMLVVS